MVAQWEAGLKLRYPTCAMLAGADNLTAHLHSKGVPLAIATSSGADAVRAKREHNPELFGRMSIVVHGEDSELRQGKPAPDIFLLAMRRLSSAATIDPPLEPHDCVVFEDSESGMAAGLAAGMHTCAVPDPNFTEAEREQRFGEASLVLSSLEDFAPESVGLPAREN